MDLLVEPSVDEIRRKLASREVMEVDQEELKLASVLAPLFQKDGAWQVLLTRRTDTVAHHKGEISFPGGRDEPDDPDALYTALRETEEEVGISPDDVTVLGRLDDLWTSTGFRVRPFVGVIPYPIKTVVSENEIAEIFSLPITSFLNPDRYAKQEFNKNGKPYPVYYFEIRGYMVWGITARILKQLLELSFGFDRD